MQEHGGEVWVKVCNRQGDTSCRRNGGVTLTMFHRVVESRCFLGSVLSGIRAKVSSQSGVGRCAADLGRIAGLNGLAGGGFFKHHGGAAARSEFEAERIGRAGLAFFDA